MNVKTVNCYDNRGGAARAAYRIHHALRRSGINSEMLVNIADSGDFTVQNIGNTSKQKILSSAKRSISGSLKLMHKTGNSTTQSLALLPSSWPNRLNNSDADVVNLHWINDEMMSISDISRIRKPLVWTLHDMWGFCGTEHYTEDFRWRDGYNKSNRPKYESGLDLNRWTWQRKMKAWNHSIHIVTPSNWLADYARNSAVFRDHPVTVIPNTLDTDIWRPIDKKLARKLLGLPEDIPLLLFGAIGGTKDPRKGFDLLLAALRHLGSEIKDLQLVIFGESEPVNIPKFGFNVHYVGHMNDDLSLRILYSAVDILAQPARQEVFGQTASEAHACGLPVISFDNSGLKDVVSHQVTGYLSKAFDSEDFAYGIKWMLQDDSRMHNLSINARRRAVNLFSYSTVSEQYKAVYDQCLGQ